MNGKWQWAGVVLFILAAIASAGNLVLSRNHPAEIADARSTGAVLTAGLAVVGAILAVTAYLSIKDKPEEKAWPSVRELMPLILVVVGLISITDIIGWWYVIGDITGGLLTIGAGLILIVVGALLLSKSEENGKGG